MNDGLSDSPTTLSLLERFECAAERQREVRFSDNHDYVNRLRLRLALAGCATRLTASCGLAQQRRDPSWVSKSACRQSLVESVEPLACNRRHDAESDFLLSDKIADLLSVDEIDRRGRHDCYVLGRSCEASKRDEHCSLSSCR